MKNKLKETKYELDINSLSDVIDSVVIPFMKKESFWFNGSQIQANDITFLQIKRSDMTFKEYKRTKPVTHIGELLFKYEDDFSDDITNKTFRKAERLIGNKLSAKQAYGFNLKPEGISIVTAKNPSFTSSTQGRVKSLLSGAIQQDDKPKGTAGLIQDNSTTSESGEVKVYYHILIQNNKNEKMYEFDIESFREVLDNVVIPYLKRIPFLFSGYYLSEEVIERFVIRQSKQSTSSFVEEQNNRPNSFPLTRKEHIMNEEKDYSHDITRQAIRLAEKELEKNFQGLNNQEVNPVRQIDNNKVFIVHGHDDFAKTEVEAFIRRIGLEPIIIHQQANRGQTIIEKIESHSDVKFGIVLYTPCDQGAAQAEAKQGYFRARARQNVVFEHGYLIGKIGRENVAALVKEEVETPNDISGVVYIKMDSHQRWHLDLAKELKSAGCNINLI
jgi:predicted nucleotide-binding protein